VEGLLGVERVKRPSRSTSYPYDRSVLTDSPSSPQVRVRVENAPHADGRFPCEGGVAISAPAPDFVDKHYDRHHAWLCSACLKMRYVLEGWSGEPLNVRRELRALRAKT
jgi:hypothetical protein